MRKGLGHDRQTTSRARTEIGAKDGCKTVQTQLHAAGGPGCGHGGSTAVRLEKGIRDGRIELAFFVPVRRVVHGRSMVWSNPPTPAVPLN